MKYRLKGFKRYIVIKYTSHTIYHVRYILFSNCRAYVISST
jgi:hypothetical protein